MPNPPPFPFPTTSQARVATYYGTPLGWYGPYDYRSSYGVWADIFVTDFRPYVDCYGYEWYYWSAGRLYPWGRNIQCAQEASGFGGVDTGVFGWL